MPIPRTVSKEILSFFNRLDNKATDYINQLIVSSYAIKNELNVCKNTYLKRYVLPCNDRNLHELLAIIDNDDNSFGIEELVEIFEYVISPADKQVNGAVYTPSLIRQYIVTSILSRVEKDKIADLLFADLSCGCGGFFYTLIDCIKGIFPDLSIVSFVKDHIIGIDLKEYSLERTRILLSLYSLQNNEILLESDYNLFCQNSLANQFAELPIVVQNGGIDVVIGNPPYVSAAKLSEENKNLALNWEVSKSGKSDLYLPFFQLGIESLKPNGILGYITVNTFYRSLNGYAFRTYLSSRGYDLTILDFGSEQLFNGCLTYTCICIISKSVTSTIHYTETSKSSLRVLASQSFVDISYSSLNNKKGWILKDSHTTEKIRRIESTGIQLEQLVDIKNGFATLRNKVYLVQPLSEDNLFLYLTKDGKSYQIEKTICRKAIKANIVRPQQNICSLEEYIIFPYISNNNRIQLIEESDFKANYPCAYSYLCDYREELSKRDKGHKKYPAWYAYGRTQALNFYGERLLFPHICDFPCFVYSNDKNLLYYDGYAVFSKNKIELEVVRKVLTSDIFWYYIVNTSKPYTGGFFSLEKRYVKHFGIPNFSSKEKDKLLSLDKREDINNWLKQFYLLDNNE